jgi:uncharacterized protein
MHVASLTLELRMRSVHSLKEKRSVLRPIIDGSRRRFLVAAAEVGHQDAWQLATVGMATVSSSASHAEDVLDAVERFVWSFPEVEVISTARSLASGEDA